MDILFGLMKIYIKENLKMIKKKDLVFVKLKKKFLWGCGEIIN